MSRTDHLPELESLRSQVAELSRTLAERDQSMQDLHEQSGLLRAIVEGTATDTGEEFFRSLVRHLAQALNVRYAFVGKWHQEIPDSIRTVAVWSGTDFAEPFEYSLPNTPCAHVIGQQLCLHESGVQQFFPDDHLLVQLEVQSYCGMPLLDKSGTPLGLLVVMDDRPFTRAPLVKDLLQIFATRAAAELQRQQVDDALHRSERRLRFTQFAVDHAEDGILWADDSTRFMYANEAACRLLGYANEELLTLSISDIAPYYDPARFHQRIDQTKQGTAATYESIHRRKDGTEFPIEASVTYLEHEGRGYTCGIVRDITARKANEQLLAAELRVLRSIATNASLHEVLTLLCRAFEECSHGALCSILLLDPDELHLRHGAAPSLPEAYIQAIDGVAIGPTVGSCGTAAFTHRQVIVSNIADDPRWTDYRDLALCHGLRACWSRPVISSDGTVLGTFAVYYHEPKQPTHTELQLIERAEQIARIAIERKRAEETLREKQRQLTEAQRLAKIGNWQWAVETDTVTWSDELYAIFGKDPLQPAVSYKDHPTLYTADSYARLDKAVTRALATGEPYELELEFIHADGTQRWGLARGAPIQGKNGQIVRLHGTFQDITERKRAEEALRASEERFNLAVRGSNTGIWDWDLRTNKTYFSPLWKSMLGYEEHELRGEFFEWEQRLHPDDRERSLTTVRVYLDGTTPQYELEHRLRHKNGSYRWILARGVSISNAEGTAYRMAGSHIDITVQKQTQEALAQSARQLRTVLDALPVGVWFTDPSGKPVLTNPAAKQIWSGIKQIRAETAANTVGGWEAVELSSGLHRWALSQTLTKGVPSQNETLEFECLDGTKKTIRNTTVPVRDEAGVILGAIVLNEDITVLRQAQDALKLTQFSVDHAVEGFLWIGPDARILSVNDAACQMLEYTHDELTTMTVHDIDPSFLPERWLTHWEELKQKGFMLFESKYWSKTGRVLDTELTVNYLQHQGSEYTCVIVRDIGERKRADEVLRSSEERFTKAFRASSHLIGITEIHTGHCIEVNDTCLKLFGYRREEVIGQSTVTLGLWPRQEDRDRLIETIKADGMVRNLEQSFTTKSGEIRQIVISSDLVQINGIPCLLTVGHDVTERTRMEEALRQREHDLRMAIEERERISHDLHDGILQSLFAVGLGLETTKSTMSQRIRKTSGSPLDQAIKQLNLVMHEIRNFIAGLDSDLLQGKSLPLALQHMLKSMTENQATRVRLAVEDRAAQAVSAEQSLHLFQIIQEAVSNCIRHGRAQEARVSLKMLKQGIRLSIRDNGRGFNPDTVMETGHGLGNMAARAKKIGGRFTVLSKVNEGTRIVLDLPKEASAVHR